MDALALRPAHDHHERNGDGDDISDAIPVDGERAKTHQNGVKVQNEICQREMIHPCKSSPCAARHRFPRGTLRHACHLTLSESEPAAVNDWDGLRTSSTHPAHMTCIAALPYNAYNAQRATIATPSATAHEIPVPH